MAQGDISGEGDHTGRVAPVLHSKVKVVGSKVLVGASVVTADATSGAAPKLEEKV